jgi:hypothetical protein
MVHEPSGGARDASAMSSASKASWRDRLSLIAQPTTRREYRSRMADTMRKHFELAGCSAERIERFKLDTSAELPLRFRSWRDAGCAWAIVDGLNVVKVQRRAGHKLIATTMKYVVEAENRSAAFGDPFPPLPATLVPPDDGGDGGGGGKKRKNDQPKDQPKSPTRGRSTGKKASEVVRTEGVEPSRELPR